MKTKLTVLIAIIFFVAPLSTLAQKSFLSSNSLTFDEFHIDYFLTFEEDVNDIDIDLSEIFNALNQENNRTAGSGFDICGILYEEADVDDLEIDTKSIFDEIIHK